MSVLASTLPSNDGYVAAAYIVFFALLLVYLTIMGIRLSRMERKLSELRRDAAGPGGGQARDGAEGEQALDGEQAPSGEARAPEVV